MAKYRVGTKIHQSQSGNIIRLAKHEDKNENYVVKYVGPLDDDLKKLIFNREINALKKLNKYDDIVKIYHHEIGAKIEDKENMGTILLEYAGKTTLEDVNFFNIKELDKYNLCLQILKAVRNAHKNGIIHRDIKPSNIMYLKKGIKIIDFGSSKIKSVVENETMIPTVSTGYSAPEVALGEETTEASDIYSIGAVFFKIFSGDEPKSNSNMISVIDELSINEKIKSTLFSMIESNIDNRLSDIDIIITLFEEVIGKLNTEYYKFCFTIDSYKMNSLKEEFIINEKMTFNQFLSKYLRDEFENVYGSYDEESNIYKFIGDNLYMECIYNKNINMFQITKIYKISIERKNRLQKKFLKVIGSKKFLKSDSSVNVNLQNSNNLELTTMIQNHVIELKSSQSKSKLFNDLFDLWKKNLEESIQNEKCETGRIIFDSYEIKDNKVVVKVKQYENRNYEELDSNIRYLVEIDEDGKRKSLSIGSYEDIVFDDSGIYIIINNENARQISKVKRALKYSNKINEDYTYKIKSYTRQLSAIKSLYNEDYSSKNLKDIILDIEEPISTPNLRSLKFRENKLNQSQKEAVNKVFSSESISLIQGPPGTGKTTVIAEILNQIINPRNKTGFKPRILVVSQSHTAVDNILEGLDKKVDVKIIRIGLKKNISKEIYDKYTIDSIRKNIYEEIKYKSNLYIENMEHRGIIQEYHNEDEYSRYQAIKEIQQEWIKRCADYESLDYQLINSATIIAGTCIGFLANEHVRELDFDYVIVDEAAKATSPELLVSIIKAKKIILVGDQNQLPPFIQQNSSSATKLLSNPKYRLFDILFNILPDSHKQILTTQYRMIRNIGDLISTVFYDGIVYTGVSDSDRRHNIEKYGNKSIIWYNTSNLKNRHEENQNGTYINLTENLIIKNILTNLHNSSDAKNLDVGVITGYRGQKNLISKTVSNIGFSKFASDIDINTLDAFQGRENDIIIYSTVRTKDSIGFQQEKERINVAFSRAKKLLIICGDLDFFYNWDDRDNKYVEVIDYIKENQEECEIINLEEGDIIG